MYRTESVVNYEQLWSPEAGFAQREGQSRPVMPAKKQFLPRSAATGSLWPERRCAECHTDIIAAGRGLTYMYAPAKTETWLRDLGAAPARCFVATDPTVWRTAIVIGFDSNPCPLRLSCRTPSRLSLDSSRGGSSSRTGGYRTRIAKQKY
jgi:hypothetical protein